MRLRERERERVGERGRLWWWGDAGHDSNVDITRSIVKDYNLQCELVGHSY